MNKINNLKEILEHNLNVSREAAVTFMTEGQIGYYYDEDGKMVMLTREESDKILKDNKDDNQGK